eukprot:13391868-Heterocapsa_arctica.AAC.1
MQRDLVHLHAERGQLVGLLVAVPVFPGDGTFADVDFLHVRRYPFYSKRPGRPHLVRLNGSSVQVRVLPVWVDVRCGPFQDFDRRVEFRPSR